MGILPGDTLFKITKESGIPLKLLAEATEIRSSEILKWWNEPSIKSFFKQKHLNNFSKYFGIPEEKFIDETYDRKLLRKRVLGDRFDLPEIYEEAAHSYMRSSYYIVEYLRLLYGTHFVDRLLMELQVHPLCFEDLNKKVSICFVNDLLVKCRQLGFEDMQFESLAGSMFMSVEKDNLDRLFSDTTCYESFFSSLARMVNYFDTNFQYEFDIGFSGVKVINKTSSDLQRLIDEGRVDYEFLQLYRGKLYKKAPQLAGLPALSPRMGSLSGRGCFVSSYEMSFNLKA